MAHLDRDTLQGWQDGNALRSSWAILWSCMATIFACTWTVLHLGIPERDTPWHRILLRKIRLLLINALAPEVVTAYAFGEYLAAKRLLIQLKDDGIAQPCWTLAHAFYVGMGSVHLLSSDGYEIPICKRSESDDGWEHPVCNPDLVSMIKLKIITAPHIDEHEIKDRSKADSLSKLFTLIQSTWFVMNSLARVCSHLPLSPLEISCLAYVFCTSITYAFWWSKPKDVLTTFRIPVPLKVVSLPKQLQQGIRKFKPTQSIPCHYRWKSLRLPATEAEILSIIRGRMPALSGLLSGIAFCCIHISAWNFNFPSRAEQVIWWICSVASVIVPLVSLLMVYIRSLSPRTFDAAWPIVFTMYCTIMLVYASSRIFLITIMFSTLRNLPSGSFTSINWTLKFPHV